MNNSASNDLEEDIKKQKDFLDISIRFEKLLSRLITIYKNRLNRLTSYSDKANNSLNLSNEKKYKLNDLLTKNKRFIDRLSSKLDYFVEFNKRKTIEISELLNEYKNRFNVSLESIKLEEN